VQTLAEAVIALCAGRGAGRALFAARVVIAAGTVIVAARTILATRAIFAIGGTLVTARLVTAIVFTARFVTTEGAILAAGFIPA
jgi:hypothetical protein